MSFHDQPSASPGPAPEPEYQSASAGRRCTIEDVRAAYVGQSYPLFERDFARFDHRGFQPSLCWPPLLVGVYWFAYRKMYLEAGILFAVSLVLQVGLVSQGVLTTMSQVFGLGMFLGLTLAVTGRWLYWRSMERRIDQAWTLFGGNPEKAVAWLRVRGGVSYLSIAVVTLVYFVVMMFLNPAGPESGY